MSDHAHVPRRQTQLKRQLIGRHVFIEGQHQHGALPLRQAIEAVRPAPAVGIRRERMDEVAAVPNGDGWSLAARRAPHPVGRQSCADCRTCRPAQSLGQGPLRLLAAPLPPDPARRRRLESGRPATDACRRGCLSRLSATPTRHRERGASSPAAGRRAQPFRQLPGGG